MFHFEISLALGSWGFAEQVGIVCGVFIQYRLGLRCCPSFSLKPQAALIYSHKFRFHMCFRECKDGGID